MSSLRHGKVRDVIAELAPLRLLSLVQFDDDEVLEQLDLGLGDVDRVSQRLAETLNLMLSSLRLIGFQLDD